MKIYKIALLALMMLCIAFSHAAYADNSVNLDSKELIKTDEAYFLPVRMVFERFGAIVDWNGENRSVKISFNNSEYDLFAGSDKIIINSSEDKIKIPVRIFNDRAYLCLCAMEKFGDFSLALNKEKNIAEIIML